MMIQTMKPEHLPVGAIVAVYRDDDNVPHLAIDGPQFAAGEQHIVVQVMIDDPFGRVALVRLQDGPTVPVGLNRRLIVAVDE